MEEQSGTVSAGHGGGVARINWSTCHGRLYDRKESIQQLVDAYDRCLHANDEQTNHELVLVTGPSGAGKTALAKSLKDRVSTTDNGFFLTGKFDEVAATNHLIAKSYGPFVDAFAEYSNFVMRSGKEFTKSVKNALVEVMSSDELLVLLESFPSLCSIVPRSAGQDQPSRRIILRGADAEARFVSIVCKFIQTISSQGYPIVLLLDDIQWSNRSTLALLKAIALMDKDKAECRMMLLCTCRDDDRVYLEKLCKTFQEEGCTVTNIETTNLCLSAVHDLLSDSLHTDLEQTTELADIIYPSTQGNAFHVWQLLKALEEDHLLHESQGRLQWNSEEIIRFCDGSSVMYLLDKRINQLPDKTKELLKIAACLGTVFSEKCLQAGVYFPTSQVVSAITTMTEIGIVERGIDADTFRFNHDQYRHATYAMVPVEDKNAFHLNIGRRLWHWLAKEDRDEYLMLVADQISRGISLIRDNEERDELARVFLQVAHKSALASSFSTAAAYLKCGIVLLGPNKWRNRYELSLSMYNAAAEIEFYCGNFTRVDQLVEEILKGARNFDDTLLARFTKIYCLGSRDELSRALDEGILALNCLGEKFTRKVGMWRVVWELNQCKWMLRNVTEQEILDLPVLTDRKKLTAMRLMNILHTFAYFMGDPCRSLLATRVVTMTLRHGIHEQCCAGFANLGLIFATLGDVDAAYQCSGLAMRIFETYQAKEWQGRLLFATHAFAFPLKCPLRNSIAHLLEGHRAGLLSGDISLSMLSAFIYCLLRLYAGDPIPQVLDEAKKYRKLSSLYSQQLVISHFDMLIQFCFNMMGESKKSLILKGKAMDEEKVFQVWETTNPVLFKALHFWKHFLAVYLNEFQIAADLACKANAMNVKLVPLTSNTHVFLQAVASASSPHNSKANQRHTVRLLTKLRGYAQHSPENHLHRVYLVEAELARCAGSHADSLAKFELSREHARKQRFIHEEALVCERTAYALRSFARAEEARHFTTQAIALYKQWGALVKIEQLENQM